MSKRDTQGKIERSKELLKLLEYDPKSGQFTWKITVNTRARTGYVAGSKDGRGYIGIRYQTELHLAHRLAWLAMGGEIPEGFVADHINSKRCDNSYNNLRLLSRSANSLNTKDQIGRSKNEHKNIFTKATNSGTVKYCVQLYCMKKHIVSDYFNTESGAIDYKIKLLESIFEAEAELTKPYQRAVWSNTIENIP